MMKYLKILILCAMNSISFADFPICTHSATQNSPAVCYGGNKYLVVWQDNRNGQYDIYGQLIDTLGNLIDTNIPICVDTFVQGSPKVAFGGNYFLVVWEDYRKGNCDIRGRRLNTSGGFVGVDTQISAPTDTSIQNRPAVCSDGSTHFLVVWQHSPGPLGDVGIYGRRVRASDGHLEGSINVSGVIRGVQKMNPSVSVFWGGAYYFVVWQDNRNGNWDIYGRRVARDGTVDARDKCVCANSNRQTNPDISYGGSNYFVVWEDDRNGNYDIYGQRLFQTGDTVASPAIQVCTDGAYQRSPKVVFAPGRGNNIYLITWEDSRVGNSDIYARRATTTGTLGCEVSICTDPASQTQCDVACRTTNVKHYFIVWRDNRNGNYDIYGEMITTGIEETTNHKSKTTKLEVFSEPTSNSIKIKFSVPSIKNDEPVDISIEIYNESGQLLSTILKEKKLPGDYVIYWSNKELTTGKYFFQLNAGNTLTKKIIYIK